MGPGRPRLRRLPRDKDKGERDRSPLGVDHLDGEVAEHVHRDPIPVKERGVTGEPCTQAKTSGGWSSRNRLSDCVSTPLGSLARPPLPDPAVLRVNVLPLTVAVPKKLSMPPPWMVAELPVKVLSITVNVPPLLMMPPPAPTGPVGGRPAAARVP